LVGRFTSAGVDQQEALVIDPEIGELMKTHTQFLGSPRVIEQNTPTGLLMPAIARAADYPKMR
jgi:hypothetical protein